MNKKTIPLEKSRFRVFYSHETNIRTFVKEAIYIYIIFLSMIYIYIIASRLELRCLTPLSTIFSYIVVSSFIGNKSILRKPPTCHQSLTMLVVIGTVCIGSCKSNYHMITTMTAPSSPQENTALTVIKKAI
jgi:hypothetical protein